MFEVKEVRLDGIVVPPEAIGMVIMQPYVDVQPPDPYRWPAEAAEQQLRRISRTLDIAKEAKHGCEKTHFTVFPEYAIPGLRGVKLIDDAMGDSSWPDGTVVLGGTDWLNKDEFCSLWSAPSIEPTEANKACNDGQSVNCCIIWVKEKAADGKPVVKRWLQPKVCPNWPEEDICFEEMFEGHCFYVFEVGPVGARRPFRFMSVLCFDWIGQLNGGVGTAAIVSKMNESPADGRYPKPLDMVFVPQRNPKPNHPSFLGNALGFFVAPGYDYVERTKCAVVFANNAGDMMLGTCWNEPKPCREGKHGYSCLIFHPDAAYEKEGKSAPSYATHTSKLRGTNALQTCQEALFRENGACIHSFKLRHPLATATAPGSRRRALSRVTVHPVDSDVKDPRANGQQIPAVVKWVCDRVEKLAAYEPPNDTISSRMNAARQAIIEELRWRKPQRLTDAMLHATSGMKPEESTGVDDWAGREERSLRAIVDVLSIVGSVTTLTVKDALAHACFASVNTVFDVVVVTGTTHKENLAHAKGFYPGRRDRRTVVVSCDQHDNTLTDRDKNVYEVDQDVVRCGLHDLKNRLAGASEDATIGAIRNYLGISNG